MICPNNRLAGSKEFLQRFHAKTGEARVPLRGGLDLTYRCNLRCAHCYAGPECSRSRHGREELNTAEMMDILDQVSEAGCLFLLITGGEPLMRKDFPDIYTHAREKGMIVTLFTNGTLLDDATVELLDSLPPFRVEVTIYGATADTHDGITGVKGSFERCLVGVRRLQDVGIKVALKTILMIPNRHEFYEMETMVEDLGVHFRMDSMIFPRLDGDPAPLGLNVGSSEAVEKELSSPKRARQWTDYANRIKSAPTSGKQYDCGAGLTGFHIDPYGVLYPCLLAREVSCDLRKRSFLEGWYDVIPQIRQRKAAPDLRCIGCDKRALCSFCPGTFALEGKKGSPYLDFVCEVAEERSRHLRETVALECDR